MRVHQQRMARGDSRPARRKRAAAGGVETTGGRDRRERHTAQALFEVGAHCPRRPGRRGTEQIMDMRTQKVIHFWICVILTLIVWLLIVGVHA